ncbi:MAG: site-2 protease family protein [Deltaproteobacteria bacterium]|nr:site-2 protease family protein [Deltaproteobacteria bacterium]
MSESPLEPDTGAPEESVAARAAAIRQEIAAEREKQNSPTKNLALFLITGIVFVAVMGSDLDLGAVLLFLGVLLFHELGHALAMVAFGYRNVSMFFIPFLGALMTGRKDDAPAWQEALVSLAGPLPGLLVGIALLPVALLRQEGLLAELSGYLIILNGFNLLPFLPLDGGHFAAAVLFQRHRHLETAFAYLGAVGLVAIALLLGWWGIGIFAVFAFVAANFQRKVREVAHRLGEEHGARVADPDDAMLVTMDEAVERELSVEAPATRARVVEQIRQAARRRPPEALATALLFVAYLAPLPLLIVAGIVGIFLGAAAQPAP